MRLIFNMILFLQEDGNAIIVNTLSGHMGIVDKEEALILKKWEDAKNIEIENDKEKTLYVNLLENGYLKRDDNEEEEKKKLLIKKMHDCYENERGKISTLGFVMTYDCNFRCPYCFEKKNDLERICISKEQVDAAFTLIGDDAEKVLFFGGEPLLLENMHLIKYILEKSNKKKVVVITNGFTLSEYVEFFEKADVEYIQVTLDGKSDRHNKKRFTHEGKDTYNKIIEGVEKCLKKRIPVRIRMNVDNNNFIECLELQEYFEKEYCMYAKLLSTELYPLFQLNNKYREYIFLETYLKNYNSERNNFDKNNRVISSNRPIIDTLINGSPAKPTYAYCYNHGKTIFVDPFGNLYSCILSVGIEQLSIGKYFPKLVFKENSIYTRTIEKIDECLKCKYTFVCGGGCPLQLPDYTNIMKPVCARTVSDINSFVSLIYGIKYKGETK